MDDLYILLQVFLATIFIFSAVAKLIARYSFFETLEAIGMNRLYSNIVSWAVPLFEILAGSLLLIEPLMVAGEVILLCLLTGFVVISIRAMRAKEQKVDCQCFGDLVEEPIGINTLIRSIVLIAFTVTLLLNAEETALYKMSTMDILAALFCSLGVIMLYALATGFWNRYRVTKGGEFL